MPESKEKEFTDLIDANKGIIYKVIRLYVQHAEDERDLFQEIVFQAWKSYPGFDGRAKFSTWLYRVGLNTVLTFKRRPKIVESREVIESNLMVVPGHQDESEMLYQLIRQVNEIDRAIITMHLDGYENEEISEVTGLTRNNVAVRLHRTKTILINQMKKQ